MEPSAILTALQSGSRESLERLVPLLYPQLRRMAHRHLGKRPNGGTLQTTELVHEAYLKVAAHATRGASDARMEDSDRRCEAPKGGAIVGQAHFLALASLAMRHVLVDRARSRRRLKRGDGHGHITFDDERIAVADEPEALLGLDDALTWLATMEPRLARVVECRFFGGLTADEIAEALGVTVRTVERDWAKARMLLRRRLES